MCSCQRTGRTVFAKLLTPGEIASVKSFYIYSKWLTEPWLEAALFSTGSPARFRFRFERRLVGVTGVEPVTLRLSSACSNQLSYTPPQAQPAISNFKFQI